MQDLDTLKRANDEAVEREHQRTLNEIAELEVILRIPASNLALYTPAEASRRLDNLRRQAATQIDPNDNGEQHEPIIWGDPRYFKF